MKTSVRTTASLVLLVMLAHSGFAAGAGKVTATKSGAQVAQPDVAAIKQTLESRYPQVKVQSVGSSPLAGLYEVFTGDAIVYTDTQGDYLLAGPLMETKSRTNLTSQRLDTLNAVDFSSLPLDRAIRTVKGNGERRLAVFADPDCPHCRNLEKALADVTDVTIYTFLYPISSLHPGAPAKAHAIWCAPDRSQAWRDWMVDEKAPANAANTAPCDGDPTDELQTLGAKLRISSTPMLFLEDGRRVTGSRQTAQIEELMQAAHKALAPKSVAAQSADSSAPNGSKR